MAVISNVFWYINNSKWWVYASYTYRQIIATATAAEAVAILNTDAQTYYSSLNASWHLYNGWVANEAWTWLYNWTDWTAIYSNWTWSVWAKSYKKFTISWTENNDPATVVNSVVYSDDAAWLTRWTSKEFDEFFWYYACNLNSSWVESNKSVQTYSWNNVYLTGLQTCVSNQSTAWDVMIAFPRRWIKMTKSWSVITLSITDDPDATSEWYQYYAFDKSTSWSSSDLQDTLYIGAFEAYVSWSNMYSYWWQAPSTWTSWYSSNDWGTYSNNRWDHYSYMRWFAREYINCLYMMKYGNPNSQSQIWNGIVSSSKTNTNSLSSQTLATYWTTANQTTWMRLFWLENWWWNVSEWCAGIKTISGSTNILIAKWKTSDDVNVSSAWSSFKTLWASWMTSTWYPATAMYGTNDWLFVPTAVYSSSQDWTKWYCDWSRVGAGCVAFVSGDYGSGLAAGAFSLNVYDAPSNSLAFVGSRLMYL